MASLEQVRVLVAAGKLQDLRAVISAPDRIPCINSPGNCQAGDEALCPHSAEYLADHAAQSGQLQVWCYLFDTSVRPHGAGVPWESIRHVTRRGDVEFAAAFQARQPGWANSMEPLDIYGRPPTMNVVKLAMMRGQMDFVRYIVEGCDCGINGDGMKFSPVTTILRMEIDDGEKSSHRSFSEQGTDVCR